MEKINGKVIGFQDRAQENGLSRNQRVLYLKIDGKMHSSLFNIGGASVEIMLDIAGHEIRSMANKNPGFARDLINKEIEIRFKN